MDPDADLPLKKEEEPVEEEEEKKEDEVSHELIV